MAAAAMWSASISKNFLRFSLVSLLPNPSVPKLTYFPGTHCSIISGTAFMWSVATTVIISFFPKTVVTYGTFGFFMGFSRFHLSQPNAFLLSPPKLVALQISLLRSKPSNILRAFSICCIMDPLPTNLISAPLTLLNLYMPLIIPFSQFLGIGGIG